MANAALSFISLKDFSERRNPEDSAQALAGQATQKLLFGLPDSMVFSIVPPAISSLGNASGFDLRLEDRGSMGHGALLAGAQQLLQLANESPVITDARIVGLSPGPQLGVHIDRDKAAALGVDFTEAAQLISTAMGSAYVGKFTNQGWVQNIWVQADHEQRMDPNDILSLYARNNQGQMVPLSAFVSLDWNQAPVQLVRYNSYESIRIGGTAAPGIPPARPWLKWSLITQLPPVLATTGRAFRIRRSGGQPDTYPDGAGYTGGVYATGRVVRKLGNSAVGDAGGATGHAGRRGPQLGNGHGQ